jgi:hypothetical protein
LPETVPTGLTRSSPSQPGLTGHSVQPETPQTAPPPTATTDSTITAAGVAARRRESPVSGFPPRNLRRRRPWAVLRRRSSPESSRGSVFCKMSGEHGDIMLYGSEEVVRVEMKRVRT